MEQSFQTLCSHLNVAFKLAKPQQAGYKWEPTTARSSENPQFQQQKQVFLVLLTASG